MNNKTKLTLSFFVSIACLATSFAAQSADDFIFLKQNVGTTDYELYTYDSVTNVETLKQTFDFKNSISGPLPSGGFLPSLSFVDSYNSKIYLKEGGGNCGVEVVVLALASWSTIIRTTLSPARVGWPSALAQPFAPVAPAF